MRDVQVRRLKRVSIHAPVKGATRDRADEVDAGRVSIHAPVKGATLLDAGVLDEEIVSIHAPVKGATPFATITWL